MRRQQVRSTEQKFGKRETGLKAPSGKTRAYGRLLTAHVWPGRRDRGGGTRPAYAPTHNDTS